MNKEEGIDIAILHLAKKENYDKDFNLYSLLTKLSIPEDIQEDVFHTMFQLGYIDGPPKISNPIIHVTKKGLHYADELRRKHFLEHNKPLNPNNTQDMLLEDTCEILFQMHKNNEFSHLWSYESYNNKPSNISVAKELLLSKGVLYPKTSLKGHTSTHLNPDFFNTATCKEALDIVAEQNKPKPSLFIDYSITTHGDNSPAAGKELSFNQTNNPETPKKKWYQKWVDEFVKNIVQYFFTALISFGGGLTIGKSCNQATSQSKFQPTDPKSLQIASGTNILKKCGKGERTTNCFANIRVDAVN
jgi:hypothetical protein